MKQGLKMMMMMKRLILMMVVLLPFTLLYGQRQSEQLDRGLIAIKTNNGVFVGWRITGKEWTDVSYNIYRNGGKINDVPIDGPSNYLDAGGNTGDTYQVAAVTGGTEQALSPGVTARNTNYFDVPIDLPPGGSTPDGDYTYSANDASIGDLDGDGAMEIILKWDPSNAKDNAHEGYTGEVIIDAYKLNGTRLWRVNLGRNIRAGAHYTQFMVADFDGDGKAEMACKTADGTVDGLGNVIGDPGADYRNSSGRILTGPEFLTMFNGETGEAMHTIDFQPARGSVGSWGDTYGNRVDRFLAAVAYFDGEHPSLMMARGYYERTMLAAYDWKNGELTMRWLFNSEAGGLTAYSGQGNHNLSVADVDNDGKDEIVYGSMTLDDDGTGLYSTGLGHGDALHVSDMDPDHPGLEVFMPHESGSNGVSFREARTGKIIWQHKQSGDTGRGVAADILSSRRGFESWASGLGLYDITGTYIGSSPNSTNFRIWWDADLQSELLDGTTIRDFSTTIFSGAFVSSNNGTKSTPTLSADIFGDWREEVIWKYGGNSHLRIYTTTDITSHKMYTLLHDSQYRSAIAWQNVAYNQPPHASFYMEPDMALPVPLVFTGSKWKGNAGANPWDLSTPNFVRTDGTQTTFENGDTAIFSFNGIHSETVTLPEDIAPGLTVVASPDNYTLGGEGSLTGEMNLYKTQKGTLHMTGAHTYSGKTIVTDGALVVDGTLENSKVFVSGGTWGGKHAGPDQGGRIGGSGRLGNGLVVQTRGTLMPGMQQGDTLFIDNGLDIRENAVVRFDLSGTAAGANDMIDVTGDLSLGNNITVIFNLMEGSIDTGNYVLFRYTGTLTGSIDGFELSGLDGFYYDLFAGDGEIVLRRPPARNPGYLSWQGDKSNVWSVPGPLNWLQDNAETFFLPRDTVFFGESNVAQTRIELQGTLNIGQMIINSTLNYTLSGEGSLSGSGGILKQGPGTFELLTENTFTGSTNIEDGQLKIDQLRNGDLPSNLGMAGSDPASLNLNNGELLITGNASSDKGIHIGEDGGILNISDMQEINGEITGSGTFEKTGKGTLVITRENSLSGEVTISGGTVRFLSDQANAGGLGSGRINFIDGTILFNDTRNTYNSTDLKLHIPENGKATLHMDGRVYSRDKLTGEGVLNLHVNYVRTEFNGDWSGFTGKINVMTDYDGGDFRVKNSFGYGASSVVFNDKVYAYHLDNGLITLGNLVSLPGSVMQSATWEIGSRNEESVLDGKIEGNTIVKKGTGRLTISGNTNTYSGGTEVEEGTLWVTNVSGSATGSGVVNVFGDAILGGNGRIDGEVNLVGNALLSPGEGVGQLTVNNTVTMQKSSILNIEVLTDDASSDLLVASKLILNEPVMYILNNSTRDYQAGDRFKIIEADQVTGNFAAIYPTNPGEGLAWDTTNLYAFGMIEVVEKTVSVTDATASRFELNIYPNPSTGKVTVQSTANGESISQISILNSTGVVLEHVEPGSQVTCYELDLTAFPAGVYLVRISSDQCTECRQLFLLGN